MTDCKFALQLPGGFSLAAEGPREYVREVYQEFGPSIIRACEPAGNSISDIVALHLKAQLAEVEARAAENTPSAPIENQKAKSKTRGTK